MALVYRHPSEEDLDMITSIVNGSRKEAKFHRALTLEEIMHDTFSDPDFRADGAWLVFDGPRGVAYGSGFVDMSRAEAGLNDGWIDVEVLPEWRESGIQDELIVRALAYLRSRNVDMAQAFAHQPIQWKKDLLTSHGMTCVRHFYQLAWRETAGLAERRLPDGFEFTHKMLREMSDDEVAVLAEVHNDTFSEHFNFAPISVSKYVKHRNSCADPLRVTFVSNSSEIVGVCVAEDSAIYNRERGLRTGWINVLGVRKPYRKRGIGVALLSEGIKWLRTLGYDTIYIGVDADNEGALGLYRSLGFEVEHESLVYRLEFAGESKHSAGRV